MTKERAIDLCKAIDTYLCTGNPIWDVEEIHDAMFMAIEALQEQKTGKWLTPKEYCQHLYETTGERYSPAPTGLESFVYCSQCGETSWFSNKYCPHCGSRNRGEEDEID